MSKLVLVVDDEDSVGMLLAFGLRQRGYVVQTALSAAAGLERAARERFDLVILDVALPAIDGIEACRLLKALPGYEDTPIIMISSRSDSVTVQSARMAGAADYLVKPFTFEDLLRRVEQQLARPFIR